MCARERWNELERVKSAIWPQAQRGVAMRAAHEAFNSSLRRYTSAFLTCVNVCVEFEMLIMFSFLISAEANGLKAHRGLKQVTMI